MDAMTVEQGGGGRGKTKTSRLSKDCIAGQHLDEGRFASHVRAGDEHGTLLHANRICDATGQKWVQTIHDG
jgi:hypothetical protein